jgi:DNA polymerase I-like protein with 3'-5' exonuclease and polymerase domains
MSAPLIVDVETTTSNSGNPFDTTNLLVQVGIKTVNKFSNTYYKQAIVDNLDKIQEAIDKATFLVLFNAKFDLHWLRHLGINFKHKRIWDTQIGEFILNNQKTPFVSLNDTLLKYGFEPKIDVVKEEYWDKGIDTLDIPEDILTRYLIRDLTATEEVFLKQWEQFKDSKKFNLFKLHCEDLLVLEEMEWNGIVFNTEKALQKAQEIEDELKQIQEQISEWHKNVPLNLNSNDHLSCLLYGGVVVEDCRIPVGEYKSGTKIGQTRYKILKKEYELPRIINPLQGTECKKDGYWKVNEEVLKSLKPNKKGKELLSLINQFGKLDKLRGTYLIGWSKLINEMHWPHNMIHGTLNQTTVITGRLSSNKPNLQNADPTTKIFCETRFP